MTMGKIPTPIWEPSPIALAATTSIFVVSETQTVPVSGDLRCTGTKISGSLFPESEPFSFVPLNLQPANVQR